MKQFLDHYKRHPAPEPAVEAPELPLDGPLPDWVPVYSGATRSALVRPAAGLPALTVEVPVVESRFIGNFREPSTDVPGLVMTDSGDVYLVNPDGTRTLLNCGGGSGLPTGWTQSGDPASVNANGGTLTLGPGGDPDNEVPLQLFKSTETDWNMQAFNGDGNEFFRVDGDGSEIAAYALVGRDFLGSNGQVFFVNAGSGYLIFGRDGLTSFQIDNHGQTTLGAIDADAGVSLLIQPTGEGENAAALAIVDFSEATLLLVGSGGNTQISPSADVTPLQLFANTGGQTENLLNLWDTDENPVVEFRAEGSMLLAPGGGDTFDSLTVFYSLPSPGSAPALRVGNAVGGVRAILMDTSEANEFSVCFDGTHLLEVKVDEGTPKIGFFGSYDPAIQQPPPSSAQDIANALWTYGLLTGQGEITDGSIVPSYRGRASVVVGTGDSAVVFTAVAEGNPGVSLPLNVYNGGADQPLQAFFFSGVNYVQLGTDGGGDVTSTAADVVAACLDAGFSSVMTASLLPGSDGSGIAVVNNVAVTLGFPASPTATDPFPVYSELVPASNGAFNQTPALTDAVAYMIPFSPSKTHTYTDIGIGLHTIGSAGSVCRLGIYADNGSGAPGALIIDAGTVDTASATGQLTLTLGTQDLDANTIYWLTVVPQGGPVTGPRLVVQNGEHFLLGSQFEFEAVVANAGYFATGISGALPDPMTGATLTTTYSQGEFAAVLVKAQ